MGNLHFRRTATCILCLAFFANTHSRADASPAPTETVYKIEVEFWHWTSDNFYWSTMMETTDRRHANFVLGVLLAGRDGGYLDVLLRSSPLHIPLDVRISEYERPLPLFKFRALSQTELQVRKHLPQSSNSALQLD